MKVCVIGLGYLGATHALAMAKLGHHVTGIDTDAAKVDSLNSGRVWFHEPGLQSELQASLRSGSVVFQTGYDLKARPDLTFICVGTPQSGESGAANTSYVLSAAESLARGMNAEEVVVGKSTVPVGTAALLRDQMSAIAGFPVHLAWNPEFLREGTALEDSLNPDRVVIGSWDAYSTSKLKEVYKPILDKGAPLVEVDVPTAELVKVAANAFLATKVSFINAMAEVAEASGADAVELAKAIGYDDRIGSKFLRTGIGFGGGCLPKDIRGFVARAEELGAGEAVGFLKDVDLINQRRREKVLELSRLELGTLTSKKILMLGLSFKPDSDDMRDSPALDIALRIARMGAEVTVHDPVALSALGDKHKELIPEHDLTLAARNQDLVILGTEWAEYKSINPAEFGKLVANKLIIDGRNVLDVESWQSAGWRLIALGRNVHN